MKRPFAATVWREGGWYISQCLDFANLKEALELYFEPPQANRPPRVCMIEVEVGAA